MYCVYISALLNALVFQPEVIEMLVKRGADLDAKTRNGETPFGNSIIVTDRAV